MNKSRIEWCDYALNIITGCRHGCPYCYARRLADRFGGDIRENSRSTGQYTKTEKGFYVLEKPFKDENGEINYYPFKFEPTLHKYRLNKLSEIGHGKNVFVGAMADVFGEWVPADWIRIVLEECGRFPRHNYLFLTKNPGRYWEISLPEGESFWYGTSVTKTSEAGRIDKLPAAGKRFVSFEPLLERIFIGPEDMMDLDWVILGAETGNRKGKAVAKPEWIYDIVGTADDLGIPVFMKDSLVPVIGEGKMRREYPPELAGPKAGRNERRSHGKEKKLQEDS